ncbi:response regulator [Leptospira idonii]|uniref:Response regulator n=1 Tax=Leptospira idonii TaxID=1193500 RepID=A0A4R9M0V8_9LEPT|nr:response regulator [Leptospira idonii]TGN20364.1 response regulator [Leptospira idonii]
MAIENDPYSASELENIFQGLRQRVVITKFTQTVKEYVKSSNPDIILLGLSFKDKKELEFVIELRKDVITQGIPIVALIPKEDENFVFNHKILGFTEYMVKPLFKQNLLDRIQSLIEEHKFNENSKTRDNVSLVNVDRSHGKVLFQCRANLKRYIFPEFKKIFTPNFLKSIQNEYICFDIRGVPEVGKEEVEVFERVVKIFIGQDKVSFIAGRHMGAFIEHVQDDDKFAIYMAPNEFDDYLKMEEQRKEELRKKEKKEKSTPSTPPTGAQTTPSETLPEKEPQKEDHIET